MGIENNIEGVVEDIEFHSDGGLVIWRKKYNDGRVGVWEQTLIETNNMPAFIKLKRDLLAEHCPDKVTSVN